MIAHIYPSVLRAVSGRGYAGCLDGCFQGYRGEAMQNPGYELPRIRIPRTPVNRARRRAGLIWAPTLPLTQITHLVVADATFDRVDLVAVEDTYANTL
jgi:hypothetical protein